MKRFYLLVVVVLSCMQMAMGQETKTYAEPVAGETIIFRFLPQDDGFYLTVHKNNDEFKRMLSIVAKYKHEIINGNMPIHVTSYSAALATTRANLASAKIRANRVKSELIVRRGLREDNFKTVNKAGRYEGQSSVVIVKITIPRNAAPTDEPIKEAPKTTTQGTTSQPATGQQTTTEITVEETVRQTDNTPKTQPIETDPFAVVEMPKQTDEYDPYYEPIVSRTWGKPYWLSVRTNLLYWAALAPNAGVEYRPQDNLGILLNGAWTHWNWKDDERAYRFWLVNPEVRWYLGTCRNWYVGASATYGDFNIKLSDTGYQGEIYGGGAVVGYQTTLTRHLFIDFNLGLGYAQGKYDEYEFYNGVRLATEKDKTLHWFGPTQAGVSLVWSIGQLKK